jgi:O-antigen/teichoic acid export membrane protein
MSTVLGDGFARSGDVLLVVLPYMALFGVAPLVSIALNYLGVAGRRKGISYTAVAINGALGLVLIHSLGLLGPAIAADIAFAFYVGGHLLLCRRVLGFELAPLLTSAAAAVAAGAAGALVAWLLLQVVGTDALGPLAAYLAGLLTGAAVLVAAREVDRDLLGVLRR